MRFSIYENHKIQNQIQYYGKLNGVYSVSKRKSIECGYTPAAPGCVFRAGIFCSSGKEKAYFVQEKFKFQQFIVVKYQQMVYNNLVNVLNLELQ